MVCRSSVPASKFEYELQVSDKQALDEKRLPRNVRGGEIKGKRDNVLRRANTVQNSNPTQCPPKYRLRPVPKVTSYVYNFNLSKVRTVHIRSSYQLNVLAEVGEDNVC